MRRATKILGLLLVAGSLLLPGCEKKEGDKKEESAEAKQAEEGAAAEKAEEEAEEEETEEKAEEEESETSSEDYANAAMELACVDMKLEAEKVDMKKVEESILGKYGFEPDSYKKAEEKFGEDEEVSKKIDTMLEECTDEKAKAFAGMGEEAGTEKKEEEAKAKPAPTPPVTGRLTAKIEGKSGFEKAELTVMVSKDYTVSGNFSGRREGKGFSLSLSGDLSKDDNQLSLTGESGKNNVEVKGTLGKSGASTKVTGSIWEQAFSASMNAQK